MVNQVTVIIPQDLREKAKDYRINISLVCRDALAKEVLKCEQPTTEIRLMHPVPDEIRNEFYSLIYRADDAGIAVPSCLMDWLSEVDILELTSRAEESG